MCEATPVVFRRWRRDVAGDGVIAILGGIPCTYGHAMMFEHISQHGEGDPAICRDGNTRAATPAEYAALKAELEGRGYVLKVYRRWQRRFNNWA